MAALPEELDDQGGEDLEDHEDLDDYEDLEDLEDFEDIEQVFQHFTIQRFLISFPLTFLSNFPIFSLITFKL